MKLTLITLIAVSLSSCSYIPKVKPSIKYISPDTGIEYKYNGEELEISYGK